MIDRVVDQLGRRLVEVPVGFKWFVPGLIDGSIGFGGEESAGASFLRKRGTVWTTDKDGILLALLASEIKAVTGKSPSERYKELTGQFGDPAYARVDAPATKAEKAKLAKLSPEDVKADFAGRREDHRPAGDRARQRRRDRRAQGDHRERLVRRPAVRHRGRLQDLRRVVQGTRAPQAGAGGGPRGGLRRAGRLIDCPASDPSAQLKGPKLANGSVLNGATDPGPPRPRHDQRPRSGWP